AGVEVAALDALDRAQDAVDGLQRAPQEDIHHAVGEQAQDQQQAEQRACRPPGFAYLVRGIGGDDDAQHGALKLQRRRLHHAHEPVRRAGFMMELRLRQTDVEAAGRRLKVDVQMPRFLKLREMNEDLLQRIDAGGDVVEGHLQEPQGQLRGGLRLLGHGAAGVLDDERGPRDQHDHETQRDEQVQTKSKTHEIPCPGDLNTVSSAHTMPRFLNFRYGVVRGHAHRAIDEHQEYFPGQAMKKSCRGLALAAGLLFCAGTAAVGGDAALDAAVQQNREAAQVQQRIDTLAGEADAALNDYRQTLARTEDLRAYNDQIERLAGEQQHELESLARQTASAQVLQQQIVPLLKKMVDTLDSFIKLDTPFLKAEREARLQSLQALLDRPDVGVPEKYRRVMEAYQVEAEYGRTIEAYTSALDQDLTEDPQDRTVNFLRVG